jgi:hypothetical protein
LLCPDLPDEHAAIRVEFRYHFVGWPETHYGSQIHRYLAERTTCSIHSSAQDPESKQTSLFDDLEPF